MLSVIRPDFEVVKDGRILEPVLIFENEVKNIEEMKKFQLLDSSKL
jgi:hypothetical protein